MLVNSEGAMLRLEEGLLNGGFLQLAYEKMGLSGVDRETVKAALDTKGIDGRTALETAERKGLQVVDVTAWQDVEATPAAPPARVAMSFAERVERLCVLSGRTAALAQQDEHEAARALDDEARDLLDDTLAAIPDAGERALSMVVDIPDAADGAARAPGARRPAQGAGR